MCGEYLSQKHKDAITQGSPPHTWRIPQSGNLPIITKGITSTYVENTPFCLYPFQWDWDHLHIRGEYVWPLIYVQASAGSPPHTWRILSCFDNVLSVSRITSTYVENTQRRSSNRLGHEDHLHIRGEYRDYHSNFNWYAGSPPHTWRIQ